MFPLGECTAYFQSAVEAEIDVCSLILAMRYSPENIQHIVKKYVIVAELTFIDALESIFTKGKGEFWQRAPKTTTLGKEVIEYRREFERIKKSIGPGLRRTVRNRGAAHKDRFFVETEAEMMRTLNSKEPGHLFQLGRGILDLLASKPIWTWGYSRAENRIGGRLGMCSRPAQCESAAEPSDGFGTRGFHRLHCNFIMDELEFKYLRKANDWANTLDFASLVDGG